MKKAVLLTLTLALLLSFSAYASDVHTYTFTSTNQASYVGAVQINGQVYIALSSAVYKYVDGQKPTKIFSVGNNAIITGISTSNGNLYLAVVEYSKYVNTGGGGGGEIEVYATPTGGVSNSGTFNITAFQVQEIGTDGTVLSTSSVNPQQLLGSDISVYSVHGLLSAWKMYSYGSTFYLYGYAHLPNGTVISYVARHSGSIFTKVLTWIAQEIEMFTSYQNQYFYASVGGTLYQYDSTFKLLHKNSQVGGYNSHFYCMVTFGDNLVLVGYALNDNTRGAVLYETDLNMSSTISYLFFAKKPDFKAVQPYLSNEILVVDDNATAHVFNYDGTWHDVQDMHADTSYMQNLDGDGYYSASSTFHTEVSTQALAYDVNGNTTAVFGGMLTSGTVDYSFFAISTYTPLQNWTNGSNTQPLNPGDNGGAGYPPLAPPTLGQIWEDYKYEIIAVGVVLFLMIVSGGRRE